MKYSLLIKSLMNELSSKMKANNAIISDTNDSIHIPIIIVIKNRAKFQIPNRGNFHKNRNITIHAQIQTIHIFNKFLKNH